MDNIVKESGFAENPEKQIVVVCENHEVIGESTANITPFSCPRDVSEDIIESNLRDKIDKINDIGRAIFMTHTPPIRSNLDNAPMLDANLNPVIRGGAAEVKPVGSESVRKVIEEFQPMLSLHGHIHESSGFVKIGRTYCFNPGSEYSSGCLRAYLVTMDRDSVRGHLLIRR